MKNCPACGSTKITSNSERIFNLGCQDCKERFIGDFEEPEIRECYNCCNTYIPDETPNGVKEGFCSKHCVREHYD